MSVIKYYEMVGLILGDQKIKRRGHVIMARTRKTSREKLQEKLEEITEAMAKYEEGLEKLKAEKKECEKELHNLELQELLGLMSEKNMSVEDVKRVIGDIGL